MNLLRKIGLVKLCEYNQLQSTVAFQKEDILFLKKCNENYISQINDLNNQIKSLNIELTNVKASKEKIVKDISKLSKENSDLVSKLLLLEKENSEYKDIIKDLEKNIEDVRRVLNGRNGGLTKELNKIKTQLLLTLSILFKDKKMEKETEIYLSVSYKKLQDWQEKRKNEIINNTKNGDNKCLQ